MVGAVIIMAKTIVLLITTWMLSWSAYANATGLVTSTHPLYLIAQAVTAGIETPERLLPHDQDGHHIQLRPQQRQALRQADFVLWVGADYEAPLAQVLQKQRNHISLSDLNLLTWLPLRDVQGKPIANSRDPHVWLDPHNARKIAWLIAEVRARQYPQHAAQYRQNAAAFSAKLTTARPHQSAAYWAYHDAYQYLETSLNLQFAGALTPDHELPPTAKQLMSLQNQRPLARSVCLISPNPRAQSYLARLQPAHLLVADETFADAQDFVVGWQKLAQRVQRCTQSLVTNP